MPLNVKKKIEAAHGLIPPPQSPSEKTLKRFVLLMSGDIDSLPDVGRANSISFLLSVATAVCAFTAYQVGYYKALWVENKKDTEAKAMVEYWLGMDKAYERYMSAISREISLRRDAWDREGKR